MIRFAALALCAIACSRSQAVSDQDLPGLVVEAKKPEAPIDVDRAARDPSELGRALARPYRVMLAAIGPHSVGVNSAITVEEGGKTVSEITDHAQIDNGEVGTYHAVYANSADYGRETLYVGGTLYLRPRYQRWHARDPEAPDEPAALRDQYFDAVAATWDLLAPGAELTDRGPLEVAGRPGRKIEIVLDADSRRAPGEPIAQRRWREGRSVDAIAGEIVLDADKGVPLTVKLSGTVGFTRDGRHFTMKTSVDSAVSGVGTNTVVAAPPDAEVVATPERMREVDDRDYLLHGIAPPLRRNADGTAVTPTPNMAGSDKAPVPAARPPVPAAKPPEKSDKGDKSKTKSGDKPRPGDKAKPGDKAESNKSRTDAPRRAKPDGATP
jgi:hypothetical protein